MATTELDEKDVTQIFVNQLSTSFNKEGVAPDEGWFSKVSTVFGAAAKAIGTPKNVWEKMLSFLVDTGVGAAVGAGIGAKVGGFIGLFFGGVGAVPGAIFGAAAGGIAGALLKPISGFLRWAGENVALLQAGAAALAALGTGAGISAATGVSMPEMVQKLMNWGDTIYDFNFDMSDSDIFKKIKSIIDSLYGQAGDFLGSSFARLLLTGILAPPKVVIDIRGIAITSCEFAEEKRQELMSGVTSFAWSGLRAVQQIAFLFSYLNGRKAFKAFVQSNKNLQKLNPKLVEFANEWGNEEDTKTAEQEVKDWRISTWVESKKDSVREQYGDQIGDLFENTVDSFVDEITEGFEEYVELQWA